MFDQPGKSTQTPHASQAPQISNSQTAAKRLESGDDGPRIAREKKTIAAMINIYCGSHHDDRTVPCAECSKLLDYAYCRLDRCPFGEEKNTCNECPVHCYRRDRREQIREVMRFAGPRMLLRHPILALFHWYDSLRGGRRLGREE